MTRRVQTLSMMDLASGRKAFLTPKSFGKVRGVLLKPPEYAFGLLFNEEVSGYMATTTFADRSSGKLVQTRFDFDAPSTESLRLRVPSIEPNVEPARTGAVHMGQARMRRGECRHVGGALVSVLGKYGLTVDALLDEIERQKAL